MNVSEIMNSRVVSINQNEPVSAAAKLLKKCNIGSLPVCDDKGRLKGMVTDRDIVTRCIASDSDPFETKISEIMSRGVVTVSPTDSVESVSERMGGEQIRRIPVTDDGWLVGFVSLCDIARDCNCGMEASKALSEISSNVNRK